MKRLVMVRPSFLEGMARIVDIGGTLQDQLVVSHGKQKKGVGRAKASASSCLAGDWNKVSHDLEVSAKRLASKYLAPNSNSPAYLARVKTHR